MIAWRSEVEALLTGMLGGPPEVTLDAADAVAVGTGPAAGSVGRMMLSFVGTACPRERRTALLAVAVGALAPGGRIAIVDHNRPRRRTAALLALVAAPRVPGLTPAARWRRLAYPTAREAQAAGLTIAMLRFAAGERIQVVVASRPRAARS